MGPNELRKIALSGVTGLIHLGPGGGADVASKLRAAADAWEADRRRLAEVEKVRDDFSYISGWTINTADVPTPYLLWQALRAALSAP